MLQNVLKFNLLAKIGADTAENEPCKGSREAGQGSVLRDGRYVVFQQVQHRGVG